MRALRKYQLKFRKQQHVLIASHCPTSIRSKISFFSTKKTEFGWNVHWLKVIAVPTSKHLLRKFRFNNNYKKAIELRVLTPNERRHSDAMNSMGEVRVKQTWVGAKCFNRWIMTDHLVTFHILSLSPCVIHLSFAMDIKFKTQVHWNLETSKHFCNNIFYLNHSQTLT